MKRLIGMAMVGWLGFCATTAQAVSDFRIEATSKFSRSAAPLSIAFPTAAIVSA